MYSILIKFPFASIDNDRYELCLYCGKAGELADAIAAMNADGRCFTFLGSTTTASGNTVRTYEGTLVGDVLAEDDDREDVFVPLVASKMKFNMACEQFPAWLMDLCDYYTNVKAMLYVYKGNARLERWRGYLMANTLNMTTVDELLVCPLVAVDEIGIAKYLKFGENFTLGNNSPTLLQLFDTYHGLNCVSAGSGTTRFDDLYDLAGLTLRPYLLLQRNMMYYDHSGDPSTDLMGLTINLEKYLIEPDATWEDVFSDLCIYLGVTFQVGAADKMGSDYYILSDTDYNYGEYLLYDLDGANIVAFQSRAFADFGNQTKIGADFQVTYKPCEWKGVKVVSTPERPPVHEYLGKDNVRAIAPAAGHGERCETRIGKYSNGTYIDDYFYRIFQYTEIVDRENQWIPEDHYVDMENCNTAQDARAVGVGSGYFPATDATLGHTRPTAEDVDSMDFALLHWGMITARLGSYQTPRESVSPDQKDYFVILNNKWGRKYWDNGDPVSVAEPSQQVIATFFPFADDTSIRPSNASYLEIDMRAIFLNENIGDDCRILENGSLQDDLKGKIQAVFPILESFYDWAAGPDAYMYTGNLTASQHNEVDHATPVIRARLSIGNHYYNGAQWDYEEDPANAPTFYLGFVPTGSFEKHWLVVNGTPHGTVTNYYYEECRPTVGAGNTLFRVPLVGLSESGQPLCGKVKLEIIGRVPFVNGWIPTGVSQAIYNNILFVLLSDVKFQFTDDALYEDRDIDTVALVETDPTSTTKNVKEVDLNLSTPSVDGVFNNCLVYDDGLNWRNLQVVCDRHGTDTTPEGVKAEEMAAVLGNKQVFVEFSRPFRGFNTDNIYNVGFTVNGLTEAGGRFMPLTRKFNWTKGWVRWKMQKID